MGIIALLLAVSGALAIGGVWFFVWTVRQKSHEHVDRLSLLPLASERPAPAGSGTESSESSQPATPMEVTS